VPTQDPQLNPEPQPTPFADLGLPQPLVARLARDGITHTFPIQAAAVPDVLAGRDVLARGQTGSGKTLAFGLPLLARLAGSAAASRRPRALVLVPTRELAMQVHDSLEPLAHVLGVRIKLVAGGLPYPKQISALRRGVEVLVATPGRLTDLVERGACDLGSVEVTVLDEADHMCDLGFLPAVSDLLDRTPQGSQRLLFSATLDRDVDALVRRYLSEPVTHSTDSAQASVTTMEHHVWHVSPAHKGPLTASLAARDGRTVIFVRTQLGADRIARQLREQGVRAAALHGGLAQSIRNRTLGAFRDGGLPVLVATDVAARGIHVDDVGLVVQADPPADHKDYLHRAGRTARAGDRGAVVTLALPHQRRLMDRLTTSAGVDVAPATVRPGDRTLLAVTGGVEPSGAPVDERDLLPRPPARARGPRREGGGPRRQGGRRQDGRSGWSPGGRSQPGRGQPGRGQAGRREDGHRPEGRAGGGRSRYSPKPQSGRAT
jgi:superfamily II DNA/RNA helicase